MAILFNTSSDFIVRTAVPFTAVPMTLAVWVRMTNHADGLSHDVFSLTLAAGNLDGFRLRIDPTAIPRAVHRSTTTSSASAAGSAIADENWHLIVGVFLNNSSRTCYLDAVAGTTNTGARAAVSVTRTLIGGEDSAGSPAIGNVGHEVGETAIWNVALDADEITALYRGMSPKLIRTPALKFYAPLARDLTEQLNNTAWSTSTTSGVVAHPRVLNPAHQATIALASTIAGSAAITEASDTSAATATLALAAAAAITETSDSLSSAAALAIAAAATITEASDAVTSTAALALAAALTKTEASDTVAATGALALAGAASITEASDTAAATGTVATSATASITEASDSASATSVLLLAASANLTEASDSAAAAAALAIAAVAAILEASDTVAGAGQAGTTATADLALPLTGRGSRATLTGSGDQAGLIGRSSRGTI